MREIMLCADEETVRNPGLIGLEGESLGSQKWLHLTTDAQEARDYLRRTQDIDEVWVASSNDVDPINLAAALKRDSERLTVRLVAWQESGSLKSRASAAGIDDVWGYREMAQRYAECKRQGRSKESRRRIPYAQAMRTRPHQAQALPNLANAGAGATTASTSSTLSPEPDVALVQGAKAYSREAFLASHSKTQGTQPIAPVSPSPVLSQADKRGYVLTVVSASGGTGKSTVAATAALLAARNGYRTALLDADLQFGDLALALGEERPLTVDRALADIHLIERMQPHGQTPTLIAAPERMEQSELFLPELPRLIESLKASFDVVIVNTGSFWTEGHIRLLEASSNALFLMDQRPASIQAGKRALDLCARCGVASHPFLFAVNRCARNALLSSIDISCALNGAKVSEFKDGGREVTELMGAGMAPRLIETRNDFCQSLSDFLQEVIPAGVGDAAKLELPAKASPRRGPFRKGRKGKAACL